MRLVVFIVTSFCCAFSLPTSHLTSSRTKDSNVMSAFGPLSRLCQLSTQACDCLQPLVNGFYQSIDAETAKLKADKSVFTIADGIVQHLLVKYFFSTDKFLDVVGEEENDTVQIANRPYKVEDLVVPEEFYPLLDNVKEQISQLSLALDQEAYKDLTVFIDPIDGTREFSTKLG